MIITAPVIGTTNTLESDIITSFAGLSLLGQNLTFLQDSTWLISTGSYTNSADILINIPFAPVGYRRNDIFVFTSLNTAIRIPGPLSLATDPVVAPVVPANTVYITFVTVTENSISTPSPVLTDGLYRKKIEKAEVLLTTNSSTAIISIYNQATYRFMGSQTVLEKFFNNPYNSPLYDGREHTLICDQDDDDLTVQHNSNAYAGNILGIPYWFADEQDLVLTKGDIAKFAYSEEKNRHELISLNGKSHTHTIAQIDGLQAVLDAKQALLISGTNIKTFNGASILGSGNISVPVMPPPFLENLIPDSNLPSTTGNFILQGSFFTPNMTVVVEGQTLNYKTFISDNEVRLNLTTGATEGTFDITLNNGVQVVFPDALLIVLGEVYKPEAADWTDVSLLNVDERAKAKIINFGSTGTAIWNREFDFTKDWEFRIKYGVSPLGNYPGGNDFNTATFRLDKVSGGTFLSAQLYMNALQNSSTYRINTTSHPWLSLGSTAVLLGNTFILRYLAGTLYAYYDGVLKLTFTDVITENLKFVAKNKQHDWDNITYIELAT